MPAKAKTSGQRRKYAVPLSEKLLLTVNEANQLSGYPRDSLYEAIHDGRLKALKLGKRNFRLHKRDLEDFIADEAGRTT